MRHERPVVIAVGDVDPARASDELAGAFGSRPAVPPSELSEPVDWVPGAGAEPPKGAGETIVWES